jgi:hypothetical protein
MLASFAGAGDIGFSLINAALSVMLRKKYERPQQYQPVLSY